MLLRRRIRTLACAFVLAAGAGVASPVAGAGARAYLPPSGHLFAGLTGGSSLSPFERLVGKHPPVFETYVTWNTPTAWLAPADPYFRSRLGLALSTSDGYGLPGVIAPRGDRARAQRSLPDRAGREPRALRPDRLPAGDGGDGRLVERLRGV